MLLPKPRANISQERLGVIAVAKRLAELGQIWRETESGDVGIDGQIEYVNDLGYVTGCLIAVQAKSGPSFMRDGGNEWVFYPHPKHRLYWERFPIPVFVMLHDPKTNITYWADARQALRSPQSFKSQAIAIPKTNQLQSTSAKQLFEVYGVSQDPVLEGNELVNLMIANAHPNPQFPLNYLELFAHGMTNICRSIYFGMDVAVQIVEFKLERENSELGMAVGEQEHEFLFGFVKFLLAQHLADVNFADCLIDWGERQMQPSFIAPLTSRGRNLVRTIDGLQKELTETGKLPGYNVGVAQEEFVQMAFTPSHFDRLALVEDFCKALKP